MDPSGEFARSLFPTDLVNLAYWGLASNLDANKEATTRFVAGMRAADAWLASHSAAEIAEVVQKNELLKDSTVEEIEARLVYVTPFFSEGGRISPERWNASLDVFKTWELSGIDVSAPSFSYDSIVDMSFWDASEETFKRISS